jgi:hypothetical protein
MKSLTTLIVVAGVITLAVPSFAQPTVDHLACYKVKDPVAKGKFTATIGNAAVSSTCTVKTPAKFACLESDATNFSPTPPGTAVTPGAAGNFLCYQAKCPKPFPADTQMSDELGGRRVIRFHGTTLLCSPASRGPVTFQSTSTTIAGASTTSTTILPGTSCQFDNPTHTCIGNCGSGSACAAVASGGACECRSTPCGDADAPSCNGFCRPDEACIFLLTGCKCASIP